MINNPGVRRGHNTPRWKPELKLLPATHARLGTRVNPGDEVQLPGSVYESLLRPQETVKLLEYSLGKRDIQRIRTWTGDKVPAVAMMIATRYHRSPQGTYIPEYGYVVLEHPGESSTPAMVVRLASAYPGVPAEQWPKPGIQPLNRRFPYASFSEPYSDPRVPNCQAVDVFQIELREDGDYAVGSYSHPLIDRQRKPVGDLGRPLYVMHPENYADPSMATTMVGRIAVEEASGRAS